MSVITGLDELAAQVANMRRVPRKKRRLTPEERSAVMELDRKVWQLRLDCWNAENERRDFISSLLDDDASPSDIAWSIFSPDSANGRMNRSALSRLARMVPPRIYHYRAPDVSSGDYTLTERTSR